MVSPPLEENLLPSTMSASDELSVSDPQLGTNGKTFDDCMVVRTVVFVEEQGVPAENEFDRDETRCWHWAVYSGTTPVGAVRLVAPPHPYGDGPDKDLEGNYLKLGRLAVDKACRGRGIGRILVQTVVDFARKNPHLVGPRNIDGSEIEGEWDGRMLAHAQTRVKKTWERYGFAVDESFGEWIEEDIVHCGMWLKPENSL